MTNYVLSIDPGVSTGIALLSYEEDDFAELVQAWQFTGGVSALVGWINHMLLFPHFSLTEDIWLVQETIASGLTISEKFTARNTSGFSYTTPSLEPLRGEGALIALGLMPDYSPSETRWRDPKYQYVVGGKDQPDKKKRLHAFLKESGYYVTNKQFPDSPSKDGADDARSAIGHGLSYIARVIKHKPTFELLSDWSEKHGN